jgi:hypothetical protein
LTSTLSDGLLGLMTNEIDRRMVAERERDLKTPAIASRFAPDPLLEHSATL